MTEPVLSHTPKGVRAIKQEDGLDSSTSETMIIISRGELGPQTSPPLFTGHPLIERAVKVSWTSTYNRDSQWALHRLSCFPDF